MPGRRRITGLAVVVASLLAGCGSSHKATSSSSASIPPPPREPQGPPAAIPPNAPPAIKAMARRVLVAGDLPGLAPQGPRTLGMNAGMWIAEEGREGLPPSEQAKERARLEGLGFITGVRERLAPAGGAAGSATAEGLSIVIRFRSASGARSDEAAEVQMSRAHGAPPFPVSGIPGAAGFGGTSGGTTGYNVTFTVGPYYYLVGAGYPAAAKGAPTRAQLITAAQRLYARVRH